MTGEVIKNRNTTAALTQPEYESCRQVGYVNVPTHMILKRGSLCLLLDALALSFLAGTIEMQTEGYG